MKKIFKWIRALYIINAPIRFIIKKNYAFSKRVFNFLSIHWPVTGTIRFALPNGKEVKVYTKGDDYVSTQAYWKGYEGYEGPSIKLFYQLATRSNVIIDIGAHVGYFTLIGAHATNKGTVYSFEPVPSIYTRLLKNININGLNNIKAVNSVVGDSELPTKFYIPPTDDISFASSTKKGWGQDTREIEVPSVSLDAFKAKEKIAKLDLIKMDCEFHEPEVIKGMAGILASDKPLILMEVLFPEAEGIKGYFENDNYLEIEKVMKNNGYYFYMITEVGLIRVDKLEYNPDERNYLFSAKRSGTIYLPFSDMEGLLRNIL